MTYNIKDIYNYNKTLRGQTYVLNQFRWIDDKYKIDFEISKLLKKYFDVADTIDVICKNFVSSHTMTKENVAHINERICGNALCF